MQAMKILGTTVIDGADPRPGFRRFSRLVSRVGVLRTTALLSLAGSIGSLGLTWLFLAATDGSAMGSAFWISLLVPIPLTLVFGGICVFLVVSLDQAWDRAHELAMQDALTGLRNRRHFMPAAQRELDLAIRHRQPLAVMVLDVDHFKSINDSVGHLGGDEVLVQVANRCRQALRTSDLLARWGGEEFIMLLPNTPLAQARQLAERVREMLLAPPSIMVNGQSVTVTASLGAAGVFPGQTSTLEELVRRADTALYLAKSAGRDQVSISEPDHPWVDGLHLPTSAIPAD
jgi:diguanylate cyclase (GGDEF)-like protein